MSFLELKRRLWFEHSSSADLSSHICCIPPRCSYAAALCGEDQWDGIGTALAYQITLSPVIFSLASSYCVLPWSLQMWFRGQWVDMDRKLHRGNCLNPKTLALEMKVLLSLGNSFDFQVLLLTAGYGSWLFTCLVLLLVFFTLFFMETFSLFQSVCTSDLIDAKASGAFGTKPHILLSVAACPCISVLKSLYMWTTRPKICFLHVRVAVNEDS